MTLQESLWRLDIGNCVEVMQQTAAQHLVDAVVCDPDYGIASNTGKDYHQGPNAGKIRAGWEQDYNRNKDAFQIFTTQWASQALRLSKPGAHLIAFSSPRVIHKLTCGIENAGWEIRDQLIWHHRQGQCLGTHIRKEGWSTRLYPAYDAMILARAPIEGTTLENWAKWGVGLINVEDCKLDGKWPPNVLPFKKNRSELPSTEGQKHTTPKPLDLIRWCIRLICPVGGLVLDPFLGSGTTLEAALLEHCKAWGIEQASEFVPTIQARISRTLLPHSGPRNAGL